MKSARLFFSLGALSLAPLSTASYSKNVCEETWKKVEDHMSASPKKLAEAILDIELFTSYGCLKDDDQEKKHLISQVQAEKFLSNLESLAKNVKKELQPSGKYKHTTTECLLLDYQRDVLKMEAYLANYKKNLLLSDLDATDIEGYKTRVTAIKNTFARVLGEIKGQCSASIENAVKNFKVDNMSSVPDSPVRTELERIVREAQTATHVSLETQMNFATRKKEIENKIANTTEVLKESSRRCIALKMTTAWSDEEADYTCQDPMNEIIKGELQAQLNLVKAMEEEFSKK